MADIDLLRRVLSQTDRPGAFHRLLPLYGHTNHARGAEVLASRSQDADCEMQTLVPSSDSGEVQSDDVATEMSGGGEDDAGCAATASGSLSGGEHGAIGKELQARSDSDIRADFDRGI
jgi:hypothetical protein